MDGSLKDQRENVIRIGQLKRSCSFLFLTTGTQWCLFRTCNRPLSTTVHVQIYYRVLLSIPEDATAFLRTHRALAGCALMWSRNSFSTEDAASRAARESEAQIIRCQARIAADTGISVSITSFFRVLIIEKTSTTAVPLDSESPVQKTIDGIQGCSDPTTVICSA